VSEWVSCCLLLLVLALLLLAVQCSRGKDLARPIRGMIIDL
jgi:hypothetical protein